MFLHPRVQSFSTLVILIGSLGCGTQESASNEMFSQGASENGSASTARASVRPGIEVLLADSIHLVENRRVGLVTNQTGIDRDGVATIDRLRDAERIELVALFSPEHGIRGVAGPGERLEGSIDEETGLPIHSLYGTTLKPTPEMLEGIDVLLFDIQDIGARYYTYVYTMALAMEAAGELGIPFVVLDRPNPIGGASAQGNVLDPEFATFVGRYPIPMRHGLTPGELAKLYVGEFGVSVDLHVVPADGWLRRMAFQETELPWIAPSPNMPTVESAIHYPGTCLFEGTNLSVGRGTDLPFQQVGAPWLNGEELARELNALGLPGVTFEGVTFTPNAPGDGKFADTEVQGVRFLRMSGEYDPTVTAIAVLQLSREQSGNSWQWNQAHFDRLAGTDHIREGLELGLDHSSLTASWESELTAFEALAQPYLIYR